MTVIGIALPVARRLPPALPDHQVAQRLVDPRIAGGLHDAAIRHPAGFAKRSARDGRSRGPQRNTRSRRDGSLAELPPSSRPPRRSRRRRRSRLRRGPCRIRPRLAPCLMSRRRQLRRCRCQRSARRRPAAWRARRSSAWARRPASARPSCRRRLLPPWPCRVFRLAAVGVRGFP